MAVEAGTSFSSRSAFPEGPGELDEELDELDEAATGASGAFSGLSSSPDPFPNHEAYTSISYFLRYKLYIWETERSWGR